MELLHALGIINLTAPDEVQSLADLPSPDLIQQAFTFTDTVTLRKRKLPLESMVWLVIDMAIFNNKPMSHIINLMDIVDRTGRSFTAPAEKHWVRMPSGRCLISLSDTGMKKQYILSGTG
jgi:hypothetical protein